MDEWSVDNLYAMCQYVDMNNFYRERDYTLFENCSTNSDDKACSEAFERERPTSKPKPTAPGAMQRAIELTLRKYPELLNGNCG